MRNLDRDDPTLHRHVSSNHDDRYNAAARACLDSDHNEDTSNDGGSDGNEDVSCKPRLPLRQ